MVRNGKGTTSGSPVRRPGKAGCRIPALPPNGVTCIDVSIRGVFKNQHFGAEQLSSSAKELNFMFGALVMIIINIFPA